MRTSFVPSYIFYAFLRRFSSILFSVIFIVSSCSFRLVPTFGDPTFEYKLTINSTGVYYFRNLVFFSEKLVFFEMATAYTPLATLRWVHPPVRTPPPGFPHPQQAPFQLSPDQFKTFMESYTTNTAPVHAVPDVELDGAAINSIGFKLPTFWIHDPDLWLLQTEAVFNSRHPVVTRDATKFNHVVMALPAEALNACKNIIRLPAATTDRYEQLKTFLCLTYGKTPAQKHKELVKFASIKEPILDSKPSTLLLHVRELSGDSQEAF